LKICSSNWKIPLYKIYTDADDVKTVSTVIKRGSFWAAGPEVANFESTVANYVGVRSAVSFNSGTSALHALLLAYGIKSGDEVIVPSFTFMATANAALFVGAKPVFADIEPETFGLNPSSVQKRINKNTKAIIPIHYGGLPCQIEALKEIANDNNLILIEDAAEALGSSTGGKKIGTFSNSAMFSFCGNKIITTGEGGVIVTNSEEISEKLELIRSHGRLDLEPYFSSILSPDYIGLGYNWRMSSITAALGIAQMRKLDKVVAMRRKCADYLTAKLSRISGVTLPKQSPNRFNTYQMYTIIIREGRAVRDSLKEHLAKAGIMSKVYFEPIHLTAFYKRMFNYEPGLLPTTEKLSGEVLTIPLYPTMSEDEMDYVVDNIKQFNNQR
jgi:perosamine synthetase